MVNGFHLTEIPMKIPSNRNLQKIHIISWLFKDIFWCLKFTIFATIMVIPTSILTVYLLVSEKDNRESNLVLFSWVFMNIFWMIHELYGTPFWLVIVFMSSGVLFTLKSLVDKK